VNSGFRVVKVEEWVNSGFHVAEVEEWVKCLMELKSEFRVHAVKVEEWVNCGFVRQKLKSG